MFISTAYAQTATGGDMSSSIVGMLPLVLMFVVLYFVMIRPQMKRQKEHRTMIEAIAKGDRDSMVALLGRPMAALKAQGIGFINLTLPPATLFLRLHDPKAYGDDVSSRLDQGFKWLAVANDTGLFTTAVKQRLAAVRK